MVKAAEAERSTFGRPRDLVWDVPQQESWGTPAGGEPTCGARICRLQRPLYSVPADCFRC